jgi:hypothetical protein
MSGREHRFDQPASIPQAGEQGAAEQLSPFGHAHDPPTGVAGGLNGGRTARHAKMQSAALYVDAHHGVGTGCVLGDVGQ